MNGLFDLLRQLPNGRLSGQALTNPAEAERQLCELANKERGFLTGYDCPACLNRGYRLEFKGGYRVSRECSCMTIRRNRERIERSGLADLLLRYTFDAWRTPEQWQNSLLAAARRYAQQPEGWFVVTGRPGTGKTHICTAICGELMNRGYETRYLLWREEVGQIKSAVNDGERYAQLMEPYKTAKVLYLDDLFKSGSVPTSADVNIAFELLNARYNDGDKLTLISSELTLTAITELDEAVGSRIVERTGWGRNYYNLGDRSNWRLQAAERERRRG